MVGSALSENLNPVFLIPDGAFLNQMFKKVGFKVINQGIIPKCGFKKNIPDSGRGGESSHGRLQGAADAEFAFVFIPCFKGQGRWKNKVGILSRLIQNVSYNFV